LFFTEKYTFSELLLYDAVVMPPHSPEIRYFTHTHTHTAEEPKHTFHTSTWISTGASRAAKHSTGKFIQ